MHIRLPVRGSMVFSRREGCITCKSDNAYETPSQGVHGFLSSHHLQIWQCIWDSQSGGPWFSLVTLPANLTMHMRLPVRGSMVFSRHITCKSDDAYETPSQGVHGFLSSHYLQIWQCIWDSQSGGPWFSLVTLPANLTMHMRLPVRGSMVFSRREGGICIVTVIPRFSRNFSITRASSVLMSVPYKYNINICNDKSISAAQNSNLHLFLC